EPVRVEVPGGIDRRGEEAERMRSEGPSPSGGCGPRSGPVPPRWSLAYAEQGCEFVFGGEAEMVCSAQALISVSYGRFAFWTIERTPSFRRRGALVGRRPWKRLLGRPAFLIIGSPTKHRPPVAAARRAAPCLTRGPSGSVCRPPLPSCAGRKERRSPDRDPA